MLYSLAYWHALAKMRLHTESSVKMLEEAHTAMSHRLRYFATVIAPSFDTYETDREHAKRVRDQAQHPSTTTGTVPSAPGKKRRAFHLNFIKIHLIGYLPLYIRRVGTSDSYSTVIASIFTSLHSPSFLICTFIQSEHEHCRLKRRDRRTNGRNTDRQVANIDVRETRLRQMAAELGDAGIAIPGDRLPAIPEVREPLDPTTRYHIAKESDPRIAIYLPQWQLEHQRDPVARVSEAVLHHDLLTDRLSQ